MMFQTTIDSEVILYLITRYYRCGVEAIKDTIEERIEYSIVVMLKDKLIMMKSQDKTACYGEYRKWNDIRI